jgi:hypothetical protein
MRQTKMVDFKNPETGGMPNPSKNVLTVFNFGQHFANGANQWNYSQVVKVLAPGVSRAADPRRNVCAATALKKPASGKLLNSPLNLQTSISRTCQTFGLGFQV